MLFETHTAGLVAHVAPNEIQRLDLGGRDITDYLTRLLAERGYSFTTTAEREIVRDMKEKLAYVPLDFEQELTSTNRSKGSEVPYELPDGQQIMIENERFQCTEALFRPALIGQQEPGIAEFLYNTILNCDINVQAKIYRHIYISGGEIIVYT